MRSIARRTKKGLQSPAGNRRAGRTMRSIARRNEWLSVQREQYSGWADCSQNSPQDKKGLQSPAGNRRAGRTVQSTARWIMRPSEGGQLSGWADCSQNSPQDKKRPAVSCRQSSGWADLNRRPQVPQTCTLNPCATARYTYFYDRKNLPYRLGSVNARRPNGRRKVRQRRWAGLGAGARCALAGRMSVVRGLG